MSGESEEIQSGGLLKRYVERADCMQNITLADWAAWYDSCNEKNKQYRKTGKNTDVGNLLLENDEENNDDELLQSMPVVHATVGKVSNERTRPIVIRSVWFSEKAEPKKHYREMIMLFTSWRNEQSHL